MSDRHRWLAIAVCCATMATVTLDGSILNVALPTITRDLGASTAELQWIYDGYLLTVAGLMMASGSLADRYGRVRILRIGTVAFAACSAVAAFAPTATWLIAARALMGVAGALLAPASMSITNIVFDQPRDRARAMGLFAGVTSIGLAIGPIAGGLLLNHFWWGSIFLVNLPVLGCLLALGLFCLPRHDTRRQVPLDPLGVCGSALGIAVLVWAFIQAPEHGWTAPSTIGGLAVSALVLRLFFMWERRNPTAMFDVTLLRIRGYAVPTAAQTCMMITFGGTLFGLSQILQFVHGYGPLAAGVRLLPMAAGLTVMGVLSARVSARLGQRRTIIAGYALQASAALGMAVIDPSTRYATLAALMFVFGAGNTLGFAPAMTLALSCAPDERVGMAAGANSAARQTGFALGVAVIGSVAQSAYRSRLDSRITPLALDPATTAEARTSVGQALDAADRMPVGDQLRVVARESYAHGFRIGQIAAGLVLFAGVTLIAGLLPRHISAPAPPGQLALGID